MTPAMKALHSKINSGDEHDNMMLLDAIEALQDMEAEKARKEEKDKRVKEHHEEEFEGGLL